MFANIDSIRSRLQELQNLPAPVLSWRVEDGVDATDEAAVWIWAYVVRDDIGGDAVDDIETLARQVVHDATGGLWAYVLVVGPDKPNAPP